MPSRRSLVCFINRGRRQMQAENLSFSLFIVSKVIDMSIMSLINCHLVGRKIDQ